MKSSRTLFTALVGVLVGFGCSASLGGHKLMGCYNGGNISLQIVNTNTGAITGSSEPKYHPNLVTNRQSLAIDVQNKKAAWAAMGSADNSKIHLFEYSASSVVLERSCPLPLVSDDVYTSPPEQVVAEPHCVVFSEGRLFVVYDKPWGTGIVAELDMDECSFTQLAQSPSRVRGSLSGPGGECVAISSQGKLFWTEDRELNSDKRMFKMVTFDYRLNTFSTFEHRLANHNPLSQSSLPTSLHAAGDTALLLATQPGAVYTIGDFHPTNTAPPSVTSTNNVSHPRFSTFVLVDPTASPYRFVRAGPESDPAIYTDEFVLLESLPLIQHCDDALGGMVAYDYNLRLAEGETETSGSEEMTTGPVEDTTGPVDATTAGTQTTTPAPTYSLEVKTALQGMSVEEFDAAAEVRFAEVLAGTLEGVAVLGGINASDIVVVAKEDASNLFVRRGLLPRSARRLFSTAVQITYQIRGLESELVMSEAVTAMQETVNEFWAALQAESLFASVTSFFHVFENVQAAEPWPRATVPPESSATRSSAPWAALGLGAIAVLFAHVAQYR